MNTDLKMRRCLGCDKAMIEVVKKYHLTYCEECFAKYEGVYNGRS